MERAGFTVLLALLLFFLLWLIVTDKTTRLVAIVNAFAGTFDKLVR